MVSICKTRIWISFIQNMFTNRSQPLTNRWLLATNLIIGCITKINSENVLHTPFFTGHSINPDHISTCKQSSDDEWQLSFNTLWSHQLNCMHIFVGPNRGFYDFKNWSWRSYVTGCVKGDLIRSFSDCIHLATYT